jgi:hypothetical protein
MAGTSLLCWQIAIYFALCTVWLKLKVIYRKLKKIDKKKNAWMYAIYRAIQDKNHSINWKESHLSLRNLMVLDGYDARNYYFPSTDSVITFFSLCLSVIRQIYEFLRKVFWAFFLFYYPHPTRLPSSCQSICGDDRFSVRINVFWVAAAAAVVFDSGDGRMWEQKVHHISAKFDNSITYRFNIIICD